MRKALSLVAVSMVTGLGAAVALAVAEVQIKLTFLLVFLTMLLFPFSVPPAKGPAPLGKLQVKAGIAQGGEVMSLATGNELNLDGTIQRTFPADDSQPTAAVQFEFPLRDTSDPSATKLSAKMSEEEMAAREGAFEDIAAVVAIMQGFGPNAPGKGAPPTFDPGGGVVVTSAKSSGGIAIDKRTFTSNPYAGPIPGPAPDPDHEVQP